MLSGVVYIPEPSQEASCIQSDCAAVETGYTATLDSSQKEETAAKDYNFEGGLHILVSSRVEESAEVVLAERKAAAGRAVTAQHSRSVRKVLQQEVESGLREVL